MQELREIVIVGAIVVCVFLAVREAIRWYWKFKRDRRS